jgi:hypothetical protein
LLARYDAAMAAAARKTAALLPMEDDWPAAYNTNAVAGGRGRCSSLAQPNPRYRPPQPPLRKEDSASLRDGSSGDGGYAFYATRRATRGLI